MFKVRFNRAKAEAGRLGSYPDLTDGKVYDLEDETTEDYPDGSTRYMLVEDDSDMQVPYDVKIFDIVQ
ncbi:MAG: hypothetical protein LBK46_00800 [Oscillospiraceae bacterium]|jgi:hypothetical protein|nr:hypothetical protein [Oscillospiraceae bacterium]